ncbi:hypothetical protein MTO96_005531 [Rhipicephalus appendiculatus]
MPITECACAWTCLPREHVCIRASRCSRRFRLPGEVAGVSTFPKPRGSAIFLYFCRAEREKSSRQLALYVHQRSSRSWRKPREREAFISPNPRLFLDKGGCVPERDICPELSPRRRTKRPHTRYPFQGGKYNSFFFFLPGPNVNVFLQDDGNSSVHGALPEFATDAVPLAENVTGLPSLASREAPIQFTLSLLGYAMPLLLVVTMIANTLVVVALLQRHMWTPTNIVLLRMASQDGFPGSDRKEGDTRQDCDVG